MSVSDPYRDPAARAGHAPDAPTIPGFAIEPGDICQRCGLHAPHGVSTCADCAADLRTTRVPAPPHQECWALLRVAFRCRACDFSSPLDGLELDERVHCAQCGSLQRLEVGGWNALFAHAHAVADLAWPAPEGRNPAPRIFVGGQNPFQALTGYSALGGFPGGTGAVLEGSAAPGFPACRVCGGSALGVTIDATGCHARCPRCGDAARYDLAKARSVGGYAVVAPADRSDRPHVRLESTVAGGPVALLCPRCGAPLVVHDEDNVQCTHCECASYVPVRARRAQHGARAARPIFVAFRGPSERRRDLQVGVGNLVAPRLDPRSARLPQLGLTLLLGGGAVALAMLVLEAFGVVDVF